MKSKVLLLFLFAAAIIVIFLTAYKPEGSGLIKVSFRNPIPVITTGQTPLFLAKEKGFFEAEGIETSFDQGSRELSPIKMVAAGQNDFGMMGGPDSVIIARSQGIPVKAIAVLHRNSDFVCLVSLKSSGITKVEQLDGKRVGMYYGHISTDVLRALFAKAEVKVEEVNVGFDYNQLITGGLAAEWAFTVRAALQLPSEGVEINVIKPADYGINTHGYTIFALEDTIEKNPELVKKFLRAVRKGISYSLEHPEEGHELIMKLNPSLERGFVVESQNAFDAVTSDSVDYPAGFLDQKMFEETYERLKSLGVLESEFNVEDAYTTRFIDELELEKNRP